MAQNVYRDESKFIVQEDAKLVLELEQAKAKIELFKEQLADANAENTRLLEKLRELGRATGITELKEKVAKFESTARSAAHEFEAFLNTVQLLGSDQNIYEADERIQKLYRDIISGGKTAAQAMTEVRIQYANIISDADKNGVAAKNPFDAQVITQFTAVLNNLSDTMNTVLEKITRMQDEGVKAINGFASAGSGTSSNLEELFRRVSEAAVTMSDGTRDAYAHITNLFSAMSELTNVDGDKLRSLTNGLVGISGIGQGSFTKGNVENLKAIIGHLQTVAGSGLLNNFSFDNMGIDKLKFSKTVVNNLELLANTFTPANVSRLEKLSMINFSNLKTLGDVQVDTKSINSISRMATALSEMIKVKEQADKAQEKRAEDKEIKKTIEYNDAIKKTTNLLATLDEQKRKWVNPDEKYQTQAQKDLIQQAVEVQNLLEQYKNGDITITEFNKKMSELNAEHATTVRNLKEEAAAQKEASDAQKERNKVEKDAEETRKKANDLLEKITTAQENFKKSLSGTDEYKNLDEYKNSVKAALDEFSKTGNIDKFKKDIASVGASFDKTKKELSSMEKTHKSLFSGMANDIKRYASYYLSFYMVLRRTIQQIKKLVQTAVEIDKEMTQLKIVTQDTTSAYDRYSKNIARTAKELGVSMTDLINATTTFARLGYNLDQSSSLAKYAGMLQRVGDIDSSAAQDAITSITKAFSEIDINNIESVMDKLVITGNNFPISVSQIAEGMTNASSALSAAGNTFDQSVALLVSANTTLQNAAKASTGLRTIAARLRNTTAELDELGEAMEKSKYDELVQALTDRNVSLIDINGQYRSTYDILKDIAAQWDKMNSMEQAALATAVAGTRQQNVFYSVINNFTEASKSMDAMGNSAGALSTAYGIYLDSIEAHTNKFKATFEELSQQIINSDFAKSIVDLGTRLLNLVSTVATLIDKLGGLSTILYTIGSVAIIKNLPRIISWLKNLWQLFKGSNFVAFFGAIKGAKLSEVVSLLTSMISPSKILAGSLLALVGIIAKVRKNIKEAREEAIKTAKVASEDAQSISELYTAYKQANIAYAQGVGSKEDLEGATSNLTEALGLEKEAVMLLTDEYGSLEEALGAVTTQKIQQKIMDMIAGIEAVKTNAVDKLGDKQLASLNVIEWDAFDEKNKEVYDLFLSGIQGAEEGVIAFASESGSLFETMAKKYKFALELRDKMLAAAADNTGEFKDFTYEDLLASPIYKQIDSFIKAAEVGMDEYYSLVNSELKIATEAIFKDTVSQTGLPRTKEELDEIVDIIYNTGTSNGSIFVESWEDAEALKEQIKNILMYKPEIQSLFNNEAPQQGQSKYSGLIMHVPTPGEDGEKERTSYAESLEKLQKQYQLAAEAEKEMRAQGGLSVGTLNELAAASDHYAECIYKEGNAVKLNTDLWKQYADRDLADNADDIEYEYKALLQQKNLLENRKRTLEQLENVEDKWRGEIDNVNAELEENRKRLEEVAPLYDIIQNTKPLGDSITAGLSASEAAYQDFSRIADIANGVNDSLETLAKLQQKVGESFQMSLNDALEFASVYPEIMDKAQVTADGQIILNKDVVNSFIEGKEAEIKGAVDAEIAKLEADKSVLEAKKAFAEAQLDIAKQVAEGDGNMSLEAAEYIINVGNALAEKLIESGMDQAEAYRLATEAMSGNFSNFDQTALNVASSVLDNMDSAAVNMANTFDRNIAAAQQRLADLASQGHETAKSIDGISRGKVQGSTTIQGRRNSGSSVGGGQMALGDVVTSGTTFTYQPKSLDISSFISQLELDISSYSSAINQIDGQIATLQALRNRSLDSFNPSSSSNSGNSGGTGDSGKNSGSGSESGSDSKEENKEYLDWIEVKIKRLEEAISRLDTVANSTYRKWAERNKALEKEIENVTDEINAQQIAYATYLEIANSIDLDSSWVNKIQSGDYSIDSITDEDLKEKIKLYQEYYDKAIAANDAILELQEKESALYKQAFDNVISKYDNILSDIEFERSMLDASISQTEARGYIVSTKYYEALQKIEKSNIAKLEEEKQSLLSSLSSAVSSGSIKQGSEEWYNMCEQINDVTKAIEEATTKMIEYNNSIRDIKWQVFDLLQSRISEITSESEFLIKLMSNKELFSSNGQLTAQGMATMGLYGVNYNTYMVQAKKYADEIKSLNKEIANDPYNQDLINRRNELIKLQQDSIISANEEKQSIKELVSEGIDKELESLKSLIDSYNEAADSQKKMLEYQKKVAEQAKTVAKLQKQLTAYEGDTSEENRARLQKIRTQLDDAQKALEETQYEQRMSDQKEMLDTLYSQYESVLNSRLDNLDALIGDMITTVNENALDIGATISREAESVGYTLSDAMKTTWDDALTKTEPVLINIKDGIVTEITKGTTSLGNALSGINQDIKSMISFVNKDAEKQVKAATSASATKSAQATAAVASSSTSQKGSKQASQSSKAAQSSSKARTDKENYGVALAIWNGNYGWGNGMDRKNRLEAKGFNYATVQAIVKKLGNDGYVHNGQWKNKYYGITDLAPYHYNKFYKGTRKVSFGQSAWTQERGTEFIIRPSDGAVLTPLAYGDSVLNANASKNLWNMANNPSRFIKDNIDTPLNISSQDGSNGALTQNFESVVFTMPNVKNYDEMLRQMQRDRNFERLIHAMSVDVINGKSSLNKTKAIK